MGLVVRCLVRVAILADHRQAGNRRRMAPQRIPDVLDMVHIPTMAIRRSDLMSITVPV
jgi:hypothetical protein